MMMKCLLQHGIDEDMALVLRKPPNNPFAMSEWRSMWSNLNTTVEMETTPELRLQLILGKTTKQSFLADAIRNITTDPTKAGIWSRLPASLADINSSLTKQLEHTATASFGKQMVSDLKEQYLAAYSVIDTNNHVASQIRNQLRIQATGMQPLEVSVEYLANMASPLTSVVNFLCNLTSSADYAKRKTSEDQLQYELGMLSLLSLNNVLITRSLLGYLPFFEYLYNKVSSFSIEPAILRKLQVILEFCKTIPSSLLFDGICLISERPLSCQTDLAYRLHNESGPALAFNDDFKVYSWHGTCIPQQVIESPSTITVNKIIAERNSEIRRVMVERFGIARFIKESGASKIHEDEFGTLYRKEIRRGERRVEPLVMVKVINSTPDAGGIKREYFIRVPPNIKTAHEAVAWTFNIPTAKYQPETET